MPKSIPQKGRHAHMHRTLLSIALFSFALVSVASAGTPPTFRMQRNEWSIHFNLTQDETLFTGDGGDPDQVAKAPNSEWIELFHPQMINLTGINQHNFWQPSVFHRLFSFDRESSCSTFL
jgi:hypothetical protein